MDELISRQAAIKSVTQEYNRRRTGDGLKLAWIEKAINETPAAQSEIKTDGDTISRRAAIRWVKTECNPYGKPTLDFESGKKVIEHLKQMPSVQPEIKTDGDTISRQAALDVLEWKWAGKAAFDAIKALPSAQPERTKRIIGKSRDGMTMWYQCESCNEPVDEKDLFCRGCGRRFEDG